MTVTTIVPISLGTHMQSREKTEDKKRTWKSREGKPLNSKNCKMNFIYFGTQQLTVPSEAVFTVGGELVLITKIQAKYYP